MLVYLFFQLLLLLVNPVNWPSSPSLSHTHKQQSLRGQTNCYGQTGFTAYTEYSFSLFRCLRSKHTHTANGQCSETFLSPFSPLHFILQNVNAAINSLSLLWITLNLNTSTLASHERAAGQTRSQDTREKGRECNLF